MWLKHSFTPSLDKQSKCFGVANFQHKEPSHFEEVPVLCCDEIQKKRMSKWYVNERRTNTHLHPTTLQRVVDPASHFHLYLHQQNSLAFPEPNKKQSKCQNVWRAKSHKVRVATFSSSPDLLCICYGKRRMVPNYAENVISPFSKSN